MDTPFKSALAFTLKWEGGKVNNPSDPGGKTNMGITQNTYDKYRTSIKQPIQDVYNISQTEVEKIYLGYWEAAKCFLIPPPISIVHFDTAVNFGVDGAAKLLQKTVSVASDGIVGKKTVAAISAYVYPESVAWAYCFTRKLRRIELIHTNPKLEVFRAGWNKRDNALIEFVGKYLGDT